MTSALAEFVIVADGISVFPVPTRRKCWHVGRTRAAIINFRVRVRRHRDGALADRAGGECRIGDVVAAGDVVIAAVLDDGRRIQNFVPRAGVHACIGFGEGAGIACG